MNLSWFANVIVHHPFIVLSAITVFSGTCILIPLTLKSMALPNFQDPQLGFSTRGTTISNRIIAWNNLLQSTKPSGELVTNPKDLWRLGNPNNSLPTLNPLNGNGKLKKIKSKPIYGNVSSKAERNSSSAKADVDRWRAIQNLTPDPNRRINTKIIDKFFCGSPDEQYAHIVVSTDDNKDLFTLSNMLAMCRLEQKFFDINYYEDLCIQNTKANRKCCTPWSLPNYIAVLNNRGSCLAITEGDIVKTRNLLKKCAPYFHSMDLSPHCVKTPAFCGAPLECIRHDVVYNMLFYLASTSFLPPNKTEDNTELAEAMIFLPLACSTAILPYYYELENVKLEYDGVKVVAMDLGIKSALFDEYLVRDTWLMGTGAVFVFACMWLYTHSLFLTFMTLIVIMFSLAISYFMYFLIFEVKFFPFMNLLAAVVAIGIGADDAFIFCKIWQIQKAEHDYTLLKMMSTTFQHAFVSMLVTALTTSVAFLGSYVSSVTAISCFSVFAGTAVVANYLLMITWFPACMVLWQRTCLSNNTLFWSFMMACFQRWCCFKRQWNLSTSWIQIPSLSKMWKAKEKFLINLVIKLKYVWFVLLTTVALISAIIVFVYPRLELPTTTEFQLFATSHPFEQYDFKYKSRFWFNHPDRALDQTSYKLPLRFVWGVLPIDNGDHLDPTDVGTLTMDPAFDMADPNSQEWLKNFCQKLRLQPFYQSTMGPLLPNCFVETFMKSMHRKCYDPINYTNYSPCCDESPFPFNRSVFDECVLAEMDEIYGTSPDLLNSAVAGPRFSKDQFPTIKAVIVEYDSNYSYSMSYEQMHEFYTKVEQWMQEELQTAPDTMKNGWFVSDLEFYDLQRELNESTKLAVALSMGLALMVLFLTTLNVLTSLFAIITISSSIFVTMAVLVLLGWKLNILESIAVSTAIGLTADFSLHYSVNYRMCPESVAVDREAATRHALTYMAGPALMAAITTGAAGALMLPSLILPYIQLGVFLVLVMCISWIYATFLLGSLLAIAGPDKNCGQFHYSKLFCCCCRKSKRVTEQDQLPPSTISDCHELEVLTHVKRHRPTPRPLRRSLSSGARFTPSKYMLDEDQSPSATSVITIITADDV